MRRCEISEGFVENQTDAGVTIRQPHRISYLAILLKREEVTNLQVTVALSSNQIVFGSICVETVSVILRHNAATAAAISVDQSIDFQSVNDEDDARSALLKAGQLLEISARAELVLQSSANSKYTISSMKNLG